MKLNIVLLICFWCQLVIGQEWIDSTFEWHYSRLGQWSFGYSNLFVSNSNYDVDEGVYKYVLKENYVTFSHLDCENITYESTTPSSTYSKDSIIYLNNDTIGCFKDQIPSWNYSMSLYNYEFNRKSVSIFSYESIELIGYVFDLIVRNNINQSIVYQASDLHFYEKFGFLELPLLFWQNYPEIQDVGHLATPRCVQFGSEIIKLNNFDFQCDTIFGCELVPTDELNKVVLSIYPNPAFDEVFIESETKISSIQVYNSVGNIVLSNVINNKQCIFNTNKFQSGVYFIKVYFSNEEFVIKKMVVKNS